MGHIKLGDVLMALGELAQARRAFDQSLAIAKRLAHSAPDDAERQRDLSVSYERLGDVLVRQGDLDAARRTFEQALDIAKRLVTNDPENAQWQRDLSVSQEKLGDVLVAQGDLDEGQRAFEQSLATREQLAASDPDNVLWQIDVVHSALRISSLLSLGAAADRLRAHALVQRAKDILNRLAAESQLTPRQLSTLVPAVDKLLRKISDKLG